MRITIFFLCGRIFFVLDHIMCSSHFLHRRQAQTDRDGASYHKIDFLTYYWEILNLEGHQNRTSGSKVKAIFFYFTEWLVSCPV